MSNITVARSWRKDVVATRLHQLRLVSHHTQYEVAKATGIHVVTLSGYETGKSEPHMEALVRLANFYGVSLDDLLCCNMKPEDKRDET